MPLHGDDGYPGDDRYPGDRKYSFAEVLRQIESKGYTVGYPSRLMEQIPRVAVHLPLDSSLDKALKACLAGLNIRYVIEDKTVFFGYKEGAGEGSAIYADLEGVVLDCESQPLPGATVSRTGSNRTVLTDSAGRFRLPVRAFTSEVTVSHVGYADRELALSNRQPNIVVMANVVQELDGVEVSAYSPQWPQESTTASYAWRSAEMFERIDGVSGVLSNLEGRLPGVSIRQYNGVPGSAYEVLLGGKHSIQQGNEPLVVVDGVPVASGVFLPPIGSGSAQGPNGASALNGIPAGDIRKIE
ncbi:MAG TPA: carboxypeptidase regulatory-like domain-containing protein, partial [Puia sp.]|nr:carboxypeptidase regulatory-like domain-containing protein [Puia sp.]